MTMRSMYGDNDIADIIGIGHIVHWSDGELRRPSDMSIRLINLNAKIYTSTWVFLPSVEFLDFCCCIPNSVRNRIWNYLMCITFLAVVGMNSAATRDWSDQSNCPSRSHESSFSSTKADQQRISSCCALHSVLSFSGGEWEGTGLEKLPHLWRLQSER